MKKCSSVLPSYFLLGETDNHFVRLEIVDFPVVFTILNAHILRIR